MCRVTQCCFCCGLRVGSLLTAVYTILMSVLVLVLMIVIMVMGQEQIQDAAQKTGASDDQVEMAMTIVEVVLIVTMVIYAIWLLSGVSLIVAHFTKQRGFLLPWIIWTSILTGLACLGILSSLRSISSLSQMNIVNLVVQIAAVVINIFGLVSINSYYKFRMEEPDETAMTEVTARDFSYDRLKV